MEASTDPRLTPEQQAEAKENAEKIRSNNPDERANESRISKQNLTRLGSGDANDGTWIELVNAKTGAAVQSNTKLAQTMGKNDSTGKEINDDVNDDADANEDEDDAIEEET